LREKQAPAKYIFYGAFGGFRAAEYRIAVYVLPAETFSEIRP
jgi:hypothetical protein